ncbi:hypothetical protein [Dankookia sp. P2]|uniref:hypothetical protein n=1 Tax=Dankookia sp. P2 TaxID=3423955 RepID=UPI003D6689F0
MPVGGHGMRPEQSTGEAIGLADDGGDVLGPERRAAGSGQAGQVDDAGEAENQVLGGGGGGHGGVLTPEAARLGEP